MPIEKSNNHYPEPPVFTSLSRIKNGVTGEMQTPEEHSQWWQEYHHLKPEQKRAIYGAKLAEQAVQSNIEAPKEQIELLNKPTITHEQL